MKLKTGDSRIQRIRTFEIPVPLAVTVDETLSEQFTNLSETLMASSPWSINEQVTSVLWWGK